MPLLMLYPITNGKMIKIPKEEENDCQIHQRTKGHY